MQKKLYLSLFLTMFLILLSALCSVTLPIILKKIIDNLTHDPHIHSILTLFFIFIGITVLERIFSEGQFISYTFWQKEVMKSAYNRTFEKIFDNHPTFFSVLSGTITTKIFQAMSGLDLMMFDLTFRIIPIIVEFIFVIATLFFVFNLSMSLIVLIGASTYLYLIYQFNERLLLLQNDIRNSMVDAQGITTDFLQAWKDIKLTRQHQYASRTLQMAANDILTNSVLFYKKRGLYGLLQAIPLCFIVISANYLAISNFTHGLDTVGSILLINAYIYKTLRPLESFSILLRSILKSYSDFSLVEEIINCPKENIQSLRKTDKIKKITLFNVTVPNILNNINFEINSGDKIAIIGLSGSGKTTLLNILVGLNQSFSGKILINDEQIHESNLSSLRNQIAYLNSDARLIHGTINNNLTFNEQHDIQKALSFVSLTEKIHAHSSQINRTIHENNNLFSAGELQRLKIARTFLLNRDIELYDEATSFLNNELEEKIIENILSFEHKTILFVTHKHNFLYKFNKILKIDNGNLIDITKEFRHAKLHHESDIA